jgi:uncharacterized protein YbbC (DUF1343 family)
MPATVMIEGATVSEGRGTTRPLEALFGAPDVDAKAVLAHMQAFAPEWLAGCALRECWFEPTFHKHAGKLCNALMVHADGPFYDHHAFRPWRLQALAFKAIRQLLPGLSAVARLSLRVCVRQAGDRRDQRRPGCDLGGRSGQHGG